MTCQACSSGIERALKRKDFIKEAEVYLLTKKARILYDEEKASLEDIFRLIDKLGYTPYEKSSYLPTKHEDAQSLTQSKGVLIFFVNSLYRLNTLIENLDSRFLSTKKRLILSIVCTLIVLIVSWGEMFFGFALPPVISFVLLFSLSLVVMHLGRNFYLRGFKSLFRAHPNMDSLIAIGTSSAFLYSLQNILNPHVHMYFDSVCVIITLVLVGKSIENLSKQKAFESASALLELNQKPVRKILHLPSNLAELHLSAVQEVAASDLAVGEYFKILEGEMVVVDGEVLYGNAMIECSAINGESLPLKVGENDKLLSGSMLLSGVLYVRATKSAEQSTLAQIFHLIQNAQESKAPIASLADRVAAIFVPLVIVLAVCAGAFWWGYESFEWGLSVCIATLVISCPCALGLATPMALLHAHNVAHKMGIFFKDARGLQALGEVDYVAFDKTGTLTHGLEIQSISPCAHIVDVQALFNLAYTLESYSTHVIAGAFNIHPLSKNAQLYPSHDFQSVVGSGIRAKINFCGQEGEYWLGNTDILPHELKMQNHQAKFVLYLVWLNANQSGTQDCNSPLVLAHFILQDHIKDDAQMCIERFKTHGIESCIISGDSMESTQFLSKALNLHRFYAQAKPSEKLALLKTFMQEGKKVAMVGDGINDAPALALSHASLAFSSPQDIATQSADVVIYNSQCMSIYRAYALSRATISNIKSNLVFAFCYNIAFIPLAMGVLGGFGIFLHPMFCALTMSVSSLSVVANAARLKRFKSV